MVGTPSRKQLDDVGLRTAREPRLTKSEAARILGISRRTVIRYAAGRLISEDRRGRVRLREVATVLTSIPICKRGAMTRRLAFTQTNWVAREKIYGYAFGLSADDIAKKIDSKEALLHAARTQFMVAPLQNRLSAR